MISFRDIDRITRLVIERQDTHEILVFRGREAWCAAHLIDVADDGVTSFERPAPRWSDYIFKLRRRGLSIETVEEKHGGTYRGEHGRYFLRVAVRVLEQEYAERAAA